MRSYICTFTGREVDPLNLKQSDIYIEDIAHALSLCNRFAGHTKRPISVAQHSVYCSRICNNTPYALQALLHDAAEAYLGDVTKWVKHSPLMTDFRLAEERAQHIIYQAFGIPFESYDGWDCLMHPIVKDADKIMVRYEGKMGLGVAFRIHNPDYPELTEEELSKIGKWSPWSWQQSEEAFLTAFRLLTTD